MEEKTLLSKLQKVKAEIGKVSKDSKNPFFKSKYFDINQLLEHVEPLMDKNGLVLLQPIDNGCVTTEIHCVDSEEKVVSSLTLPNIADPQKIGSAITYYRRYTLASLLGLQAEDDDGNKASKPIPKAKPFFTKDLPAWKSALNKKSTIEALKGHFRITEENAKLYTEELSKK